jgi:uncharacterized protein
MIFIFATLTVSWLLLWSYERRHVGVLGISPTLSRLEQLLFGFGSSSIVACIGFYTIAVITSSTLTFNPDFTIASSVASAWWMFKSVLTEELLFRGALLYIAIRLIGVHRACLLSAVGFGIYHWFSYGVIGDPIQMIYVFLLTGAAGVMFAYAFAYTGALYLPIGLHLGWNIAAVVIFSQGPLGDQMLVVQDGRQVGWLTIPFFIYQVSVLPLIGFFYMKLRGFRLMQSAFQKGLPA